ncbi:MAG: hypothetical protein H0W24_05220 [Lysobacter sp.]|nr:hypothetical protein [Lysobacter sp.]MDQ3268813.1 hypothetical protein [Pseudomonadota bacterium]
MLWSQLDTDNDGRISSVESSMHPQLGEHFSQLDADGDGFLTVVEFRGGAKQDPASFSGDADIDQEAASDNKQRSRDESSAASDARGQSTGEEEEEEDDRDGG